MMMMKIMFKNTSNIHQKHFKNTSKNTYKQTLRKYIKNTSTNTYNNNSTNTFKIHQKIHQHILKTYIKIHQTYFQKIHNNTPKQPKQSAMGDFLNGFRKSPCAASGYKQKEARVTLKNMGDFLNEFRESP